MSKSRGSWERGQTRTWWLDFAFTKKFTISEKDSPMPNIWKSFVFCQAKWTFHYCCFILGGTKMVGGAGRAWQWWQCRMGEVCVFKIEQNREKSPGPAVWKCNIVANKNIGLIWSGGGLVRKWAWGWNGSRRAFNIIANSRGVHHQSCHSERSFGDLRSYARYQAELKFVFGGIKRGVLTT